MIRNEHWGGLTVRARLSIAQAALLKIALLAVWVVPTAAVGVFVATAPSLKDTFIGVMGRATWGLMMLIGGVIILQSKPQFGGFRPGRLIRTLAIVFAAESALLLLVFGFVSGVAGDLPDRVAAFLTLPLQVAIGMAAGLWLYDSLRGK